MEQMTIDQCPGFDPDAWLAAFRENGGYWLAFDGRVSIGIMLDGDDAKERAANRMLAKVRADPATRKVLRNHILTATGRA